MAQFQRIGVLAHPTRPQTIPVADQIAASLRARGIHTWLLTEWTPEEALHHVHETDMVIAIGGDGAMLRAARVFAPYAIPILGVNMGHLGFLTEIQPDDADTALEQVFADNFWVEKRMMLDVSVERGGVRIAAGEALNEAVIGRGSVTRLIRLHVYIDGGWTTTANADALIIATATGSTAYALAVDGPILPPELRNILVVPVAPHLSLDRPIVLPEGVTVTAVVASTSQVDAVVALDGELLAELQVDDCIRVQASQHVSQFVRLRERMYFYRSLLDRLEPRMSAPAEP